jgi:hypothetical protein
MTPEPNAYQQCRRLEKKSLKVKPLSSRSARLNERLQLAFVKEIFGGIAYHYSEFK